MMQGRINKYLKENSLLEQPFVKNPELSVGKLVQQAGASVNSFVRYEVGEGIAVEAVDFAEEVAAQVKRSEERRVGKECGCRRWRNGRKGKKRVRCEGERSRG